jgi:hypothetical protein
MLSHGKIYFKEKIRGQAGAAPADFRACQRQACRLGAFELYCSAVPC